MLVRRRRLLRAGAVGTIGSEADKAVAQWRGGSHRINQADQASTLSNLAFLLDSGVLTQEEFDRARSIAPSDAG